MPKTIKTSVSSKRCIEKDSSINQLSRDELRELLMINTYKLALTRAQIDALVEIMIKKGLTTYDEVWKKTNEIFKENKRD
jgi:polyhydroxyalkanoate synthesis regulator phasin